jgi:hypothetical protein
MLVFLHTVPYVCVQRGQAGIKLPPEAVITNDDSGSGSGSLIFYQRLEEIF